MLLPTIVAFLFGLGLGPFLPFLPCTILSLFIGCAVALLLCERFNHLSVRQGSLLFGAVLVGLIFWTLHSGTDVLQSLQRHIGSEPVMVRGVIVDPVHHSPGRMVMVLNVATVEEESQVFQVSGLLRLTWRNPESSVYRGDLVQVRTQLRMPYGTKNPGGFDYGAHLLRQGIAVVATVQGPQAVQVLSHESSGWWGRGWHHIDEWRDQIRQAALSTLEGDALGLFLGMIVGEQSFISPEVRDQFMTTGTVHILSISGSHLGLLGFLSFWVVQGITRRLPSSWVERLSCRMTANQFAVLATIPLVLFYTVVSGAHVATVRSLLMVFLYLLAVWLGHARQVLIALGLSAVLVTFHDPTVLQEISFQLSYGAVLVIALALRWWERNHAEDPDIPRRDSTPLGVKMRMYAVVSTAVTVATMPLVAFYFNQIAWLGIFCNMVVVPFVGFLLVPLGILSAISLLVTGREPLPLDWLLQDCFDGLVSLVGLLASVPGAEWHVASPAPLALMAFYAGLTVIIVSRRWACRVGAVGVLVGLTCWWGWSPQEIFDPNHLRVTYLDVGQGDATVIELPDRQTILIDGGAAYSRWDMGRMAVGPFLWDQGIRHIDHVVATHPQLDHVGGLAWVLNHFQVGHFWDNGMSRKEWFWEHLQSAVRANSLVSQVAWEGRNLLDSSSSCVLISLNPPSPELGHGPDSGQQRGSFNNQSVVLKLTCGPHTFLFPADVEFPTLSRLSHQDPVETARVIKVPHHGAKSSLLKTWIQGVQGEIAVVSAGQGNRYGHPAGSVLKVYRELGYEVFQTNRDGAVWIDADIHQSSFSVHTNRMRELERVDRAFPLLDQELANLKRLWEQGLGRI